MTKKIHVPDFWSVSQQIVWEKQEEIRTSLNLPRETLAEIRYGYAKKREYWNFGGPDVVCREFCVGTPYGSVNVRLYEPEVIVAQRVIVYAHGGGWIVGDLNTHDRLCRELAVASETAVLAVDYTLSPEAKYPQALIEFLACVGWAQAHFDQVWCAGDSAGATLSLGAALWMRDADGRIGELALRPLQGLLLFYGGYGLRDSQSRRTLGGYWDGMDDADCAAYEAAYRVPGEPAPYHDLLDVDLSFGIPPTFILGAEFDPLRDDSRALYARLQVGKSRVEYHEVPGVLHAFLQYGRLLPEAAHSIAQAANFLRA
ncbi:acetyl esterase [Arcanobacterium pluranimalium]|uniref:alpha/beta hydrolase fold domain-containing protein n=1 Tax=Arcanobacterium pluranimalium TaxID=108028 RepID=UPI00195A7AA6|nr:alpha/beta hydrolase fold domain-containing protein [Arcanobacterium pluranimalium]MBM7824632.1 acetyl esterase [Arcanobacterium pluranimalium]